MHDARDAETPLWDAVIVGTGMGGGTVGHALASAGWRVLFLERGKLNPDYRPIDTSMPATPEERLQIGFWPQWMQWRHDGQSHPITPPVNCGVGGTTLFYGAALERFDPIDFVRDGSDDERAPWPITYESFKPYYERAEQLYRVRKSDPRNFDGLSEWDRALAASMKQGGLDPVRLNVGIAYKPNCQECVGEICRWQCKSDAASICVQPAMERYQATLVTECEVTRIDADRHEAKSVVATVGGVERRFRGRIVIVSAGALHSPALLLKSKNEHWPQGVGNDADQVGRNLMFHVGQIIPIVAPKSYAREAPCKKSLLMRDFYRVDGKRLGTIQSMGLDAGAGLIEQFLKSHAIRFPLGNLRIVQKLFAIPAKIASRLMGRARMFGVNIEDMPNPDNRVVLDPSTPNGTRIDYTVTDEARVRAAEFRKRLAAAIRPWRLITLVGGEEPNFGHACGTCRMGDDPSTSVLDASNRVHGMRNLYVVDASFMPTSAAVNPSLTVAANALRVADGILASMPRHEAKAQTAIPIASI